MSEILLEVVQPSGVRQFVPLGDAFLTLGRGYDRDVVVADDFLSAAHLSFRRVAGGVEVTDEGSENGTRVQQAGQARQALEGVRCLPVGSRLIAGTTLIIIRDRHEPVPPARALRTGAHGGDGWWERHAWWILMPVLMAVAWGSAWLQRDERDDWGASLGRLGVVMLLVALWSSLWALVGKLSVHRAHYLQHLGLACVGGLSVFAIDYAREIFLFATEMANPPSTSVYAHELLLFNTLLLVAMFWLLYAHLGVATLLRQVWRTVTASSVPAMIALLIVVDGALDATHPREQSAIGEWMLPVSWRLERISTQEAFLAGLETLEQRANAEAARSPEWRLDFPGEESYAPGASKSQQ